jgi:hypothetical protein
MVVKMIFTMRIAPWLPLVLAIFEQMARMGYDISPEDIDLIILDALESETV